MAGRPGLIGSTIGSYDILEQIGMGSMATVYKAYQASMNRYVAIKVMAQQFSEDDEFIQRFRNGAWRLATFEHRHILPEYDNGKFEGMPYLVMRYMDGGTLRDRLEDGPMPLHKASHLLDQVAGALDFVHWRGVIHRDVKPSKILFDADGDAYLTGFSFAISAELPPDPSQTTIGSPAYTAPEVSQAQPATFISDQYALGVVLYEMVTGRVPFMGKTPIATAQMHINDTPPAPSDFRPDLPEAVEQVILRALAKEPSSRYKTVGKMAAAFADAIGESR